MAVNDRPRHITLTGTYRSSNRGDAAMELVALESLVESGHTVVVDTPFPGFDAHLYGEGNVVRCGRRSPARIVLQTLLAAVVGLGRRLRVPGSDLLLLTDELSSLGTPEGIVVDLSGDMLTEDYGFAIGLSHFVPILQAMLLGTPVAICAQSIGPFRRLRPLARAVLSRSSLITLREETSVEHLEAMGVSSEVTADVAFLLDGDLAAGRRALRLAGVEGAFLAVSVSPILEARHQEARHDSEAPSRSFARAVAAALDEVVPEELDIVFIAHVTGPGDDKDDRCTASRVAAEMKRSSVQLTDELDPRVTKGVIGHAEAMLGCRMHANIAALSQGIPALALSYSHKSAGIMARLGLPERVVDGRDLDRRLASALAAMLEQLEADRGVLRSSLPGTRVLAQRNFELIDGLLHRSTEQPVHA